MALHNHAWRIECSTEPSHSSLDDFRTSHSLRMNLSISLGVLAALQVGAGLLIQIVVLRLLGAGGQTDAYVAAQSVPLVLFSILAVSMQNVWQPRLALLRQDSTRWRETQRVAQTQAFIAFGASTFLLWVAAPMWVPGLFPGFGNPAIQLTISMVLPFLGSAMLNGHSFLFTAALRTRDRFISPELISLCGTLIAVCLIAIAVPRYGVKAAAWITFARAAFVCTILHWQADRPTADFSGAWTERSTWRQLRLLLLGSAFYKTGPLVDRFWASHTAGGAMTVFVLTQAAVAALSTVLERALCVPQIPQLARLVGTNKMLDVRRVYRRSILNVTWATVAIAVALIAVYPAWAFVVSSVLGIPASLAADMWLICMLLLGYLHVAASGTVAVSVYYAMGDMRTPVVVGVSGFIASIVIKSAGYLLWGLPGLAAAISIYYLGNLALLCALLEAKINARLP